MKDSTRFFVVLTLILLLLQGCSNRSQDEQVQVPENENVVQKTEITQETEITYKTEDPCQPSFSNAKQILETRTQADLWWVDSSDFNDDGWADILLTRGIFQSGDTFELDILLNDGRGSYYVGTSDVFSGSIPSSMEPREVLLADFNGDSRTDIFIVDQGMDSDPWPGYQNTLILSVPGGKMVDATGNLPQQSDQSHSAAAADIDGDKDIDIFVGNMGGGGVAPQMLINNGNGIFKIDNSVLPPDQTNLMVNWYTSCEFVDINKDSSPDLVLGQGEIAKDSHILINDGNGHFNLIETPLPTSFFAPNQQVIDIKGGDINSDGFQDLVIVETRNTYNGWYIQILINNKDNTFKDESALRIQQSGENSPSFMWWVDLIDLNNDGAPDIIASPLESSSGPLIFMNDGLGFFSQEKNFLNVDHPYFWSILDLNNDGVDDFFWSYPRGYGCCETHFVVKGTGCQ